MTVDSVVAPATWLRCGGTQNPLAATMISSTLIGALCEVDGTATAVPSTALMTFT
jgi:hypothetical protein